MKAVAMDSIVGAMVVFLTNGESTPFSFRLVDEGGKPLEICLLDI